MTDNAPDDESILAANARFYRAMASGDLSAMTAVWSDGEDIACTHPGHPTLVGQREVMESWFDILQAPPPIACEGPRVIHAGHCAFVVCYERIDGHLLAATNVFRRAEGGWRMVHHHAGPVHVEPANQPARGNVH